MNYDDIPHFDFTWNYRIVNDKRGNGGEDWYCLKEVAYDDLGKPTGYGDPCLGAEDMESFMQTWEWIAAAMTLPPLQPEDFTTKETEA
jgi:hypothetical protein